MSLRIDLSSDTIAAVSSASSLAVVASSPVLALCRKLVGIGYPLSADLECYRSQTLALRVRSIGEAARLEINSGGTGFAPRRESRRGSPMSQSEPAATTLQSSF